MPTDNADSLASANTTKSCAILFVGDPPKFEEELERGHPFGGKAGRVFRSAIEGAAIPKKSYACTFVAWPTEGEFVELKTISRMKPFVPNCLNVINTRKPQVVVLVGANALKLLCGEDRKIADWANKPFVHTFEGHECIAYPIFSPGYIMYQDHLMPDYFAEFVKIKKAADEAEEKVEQMKGQTIVDYRTFKTLEECSRRLQFFHKMGKKGKVIAWDLETSGFNPHEKNSSIGVLSLSCKEKTASVFIWDHDESDWSKKEKKVWYEMLHNFFAAGYKLIAHNGKFDCKWIKKFCGVFPELFADTILMHHIVNEVKGTHGLKTLATNVGMGGYEDELDKYIPDKKVFRAYLKPPMHVVAYYASADSDCCLRVYSWLKSQIDADPRFHQLAYGYTPKTSHLISQIEYNGTKIDRTYAMNAVADYEKKTAESLKKVNDHPSVIKYVKRRRKHIIEEHIEYVEQRKKECRRAFKVWEKYCAEQEEAGKKVTKKKPVFGEGRWKYRDLDLSDAVFNCNSPDQLREVLFNIIGHEPLHMTKGGEPSTNKESLIWYKNFEECSFSSGLMEYRMVSKLLGTYLKPIVEMSGISSTGTFIYPSFNLSGTETSRISSQAPNWMNLPSGSKGASVRRCIVSRFEGGHLASYDQSQIELRLAGALSHDPVICKVYRTGGDIHTETCTGIYDISVKQYDRLEKGEKKDKRRVAKVYNFGCVDQRYKIVTDRGVLSVDEVKIGDFTHGWDKNQKLVKTKITNVYRYAKTPIWHIIFQYAGSLICTGNHRWLRPDGTFILTQAIEEGDRISTNGSQTIVDRVVHIDDTDNFGPTWCVTTECGSWMMHDGTKSILTGNSIYGGGPTTIDGALRKEDPPVIIDMEELKIRFSKFKDKYKVFFAWTEKMKQRVQKKGYVFSVIGRRRQFPQVNSTDEEQVQHALRAGVNHLIQNVASELVLMSAVVIQEMLQKKGMKTLVNALIHDDIRFDVYPGEQDYLDKITRDVMVNIAKYAAPLLGEDYDWLWLNVPLAVGADFGYNWRDMIEIGSKVETGEKDKDGNPVLKEMKTWKDCLEESAKKMKKDENLGDAWSQDTPSDAMQEAFNEAIGIDADAEEGETP